MGVKNKLYFQKVHWLSFSSIGKFEQAGFGVSMNLENYKNVCLYFIMYFFPSREWIRHFIRFSEFYHPKSLRTNVLHSARIWQLYSSNNKQLAKHEILISFAKHGILVSITKQNFTVWWFLKKWRIQLLYHQQSLWVSSWKTRKYLFVKMYAPLCSLQRYSRWLRHGDNQSDLR